MRGMNRITGRPLSGRDHLYQSVADILTTPIGTRVMRRDYGSRLFDLIDRPAEPGLRIEIIAAVAEALDRWEPRFRLRHVGIAEASAGHLTLDLRGDYLPEGREVTLQGVTA